MIYEMNPEIKMVLEKINFVDRYKILSEQFRGNSNDLIETLEYYDIEKVIEIFKKLGYDAAFDNEEYFFKVGDIENSPNYKIWFNIRLEYGMTEFIWVVYHNNEVRLGSPWGIYTKFLNLSEEKIKMPFYRSYEQLEEILKEAFLIYDDFKSELIILYNK